MSDQRHRFSIVLGQRMSWPELLEKAIETESLGFDGLFLVIILRTEGPGRSDARGVHDAGGTRAIHTADSARSHGLRKHIPQSRLSSEAGDLGRSHLRRASRFWSWSRLVEREHEASAGNSLQQGKRKVDRFAEALEIWTLLQSEERTTYQGAHYQLLDAPFQPKSLQPGGLPVLIGGSGPRMLRLTAKYADLWIAAALRKKPPR